MITISISDPRLVGDLVGFLARAHCVRVEPCGRSAVRAVAPPGLDEAFVARELLFHLLAWERQYPHASATLDTEELGAARAGGGGTDVEPGLAGPVAAGGSAALRRGARRRLGTTLALVVVPLLLAAPAHAERRAATFPAVATVVQPGVARAAPRPAAAVVARLAVFRRDFRPTVVLAIAAKADRRGRLWYRVRIPARGNRLTGWVAAGTVSVEPARTRIVVRRSARVLEVYRGSRRVVRTRVAVGKAGADTPLGSFFVTARFRPSLPVLGRYALETSAYSRLSDWPGGGVVGIHGTPWPWLLGKAVSHGCIRVSNEAIVRLKALAPVGTPVDVVR